MDHNEILEELKLLREFRDKHENKSLSKKSWEFIVNELFRGNTTFALVSTAVFIYFALPWVDNKFITPLWSHVGGNTAEIQMLKQENTQMKQRIEELAIRNMKSLETTPVGDEINNCWGVGCK